jgi:hypothetical protein
MEGVDVEDVRPHQHADRERDEAEQEVEARFGTSPHERLLVGGWMVVAPIVELGVAREIPAEFFEPLGDPFGDPNRVDGDAVDDDWFGRLLLPFAGHLISASLGHG